MSPRLLTSGFLARGGTSNQRPRSAPGRTLLLTVWSGTALNITMGAATRAAAMIIAAYRVQGGTPSLVPGHTRDPRRAGAHWFGRVQRRAEVGAARGSTASVKREKLCVHGRPIGQLGRRGVFAKRLVVCKPNPSAKLARNPQDK